MNQENHRVEGKTMLKIGIDRDTLCLRIEGSMGPPRTAMNSEIIDEKTQKLCKYLLRLLAQEQESNGCSETSQTSQIELGSFG